MTTTAYHLTA